MQQPIFVGLIFVLTTWAYLVWLDLDVKPIETPSFDVDELWKQFNEGNVMFWGSMARTIEFLTPFSFSLA